ncbi:MAG: hypothetical protein ACPHVZ_10315 [Psychrobacter sp.]|jgi:hypothetical protein|uniref:hypothetical protein n=1 Tax=Psychrobacter TaxID=497 RepID=UPI000420AE05|nr:MULTISPECIES: hypothetical protein [Psychrobacter]MCG3882937.1 hypothetical protein [Psychrobacter sp. Ps3]HAM61620.1 hypothetical protein [Psychrobacter sp.]|tara:strand:- start:2676 stop:3281 length:606 start_codon:yes stop_codon:yes gene_type:complete
MKKSNHFANPFAAWGGHRLFHVVAGTLVGAMVVTQASAMLPTPEPALDNSSAALQTAALNANNPSNTNSNAQAVNTKITASLVGVDANGNETLVPVTAETRLQSGNILEYQGYFTNTNADRVRKMTVTMSIPEQVELLGGVMPDFPYGSVDGNSFSRMPLRGNVNGQNQEIPLGYYKAVRWDIEGVGLNDTVMVQYRAKVK